ncbi:MAG: 5'/3'-nucleotidase SurE [Rhizobiales bacterium]|nr:5'/3'-nucleotidase SurE [Hyphomicrobiales bacterium]
MRILITNDDGIHSDGLDVCAEIGKSLSDDVWVIAPEFDQSGVSHSLSLNDPLRLRAIGERRFAVKGTPTDCVLMGSSHVLKERPPDLILSGVNHGRNTAEDVIYSGTVAGAVEGAVLGIPSIALSQAYSSRGGKPPNWDIAPHYAPAIIRKLIGTQMPRGVLVNINFPNCKLSEVKGVAVTSLGRHHGGRLRIDQRTDGRGNAYYWIAYVPDRSHRGTEGTDVAAIADNKITITPLRIDMTDEPFMTKLAEQFAKE